MLDNLVNKAKNIKSSTWKWILGVCIAVLVFFSTWWLKRRYNELMRLRTEKKLFEERQKDMILEAELETEKNIAAAFKEEADYLRSRIVDRKSEIFVKERAYLEAKKKIADAKNWEELEKEVGKNNGN